ncbi:PhzF family phenazine biosynthesis protein [Legionella drozanskii]|nr:PhzF family phenazine biosynthesis isomerase [Legionella drozanskii]
MRVFQVNCFCTEAEVSGNPAAVVIDCDALSSIEKQEIAKSINFPVTTFISNFDTNIPQLEYYYPETQMPLCLHGTIAAAHWLFTQGDSSISQIECNRYYHQQLAGKLLIESASDGCIYVEVANQNMNMPNFNYVDLARQLLKLSLPHEALFDTTLPFGILSVGSPKFFIPVKTKKFLENINPDQNAIIKWSIENKINGLYVYTLDKPSGDLFYARGFNPQTGYLEDAATGVAAGALSCSLNRSISVYQGSQINRPSKINVNYKG